ncbi:MAG: phenylalanine--tRNA ligase subunit beta [Pseudomonadota bacterium]
MKFPLSWLKWYLDTAATLDEISQKLTAIGLEVEGIEDRASTFKGFVVGHIVSAEKHPDADKLQCLIVDTGKEKLKVVCGAPNAHAGMKGVFAPAGSYIPGSDMTLKKTLIRGQESNGMMCSERELLLSEEHKGVIELPDSAVTGSPAADALGVNDPVIEINLTPNRGDCASVYGIARDLAATGIGTLKPPKAVTVAGKFKNPVSVILEDTQTCPLFIGRYIRGVKNGASPKWLQDHLKAVGQKPISVLVDITNYMTLGLNRPLHVFDADKLKGNIHVQLSRKGEKLEALNDKTYDLDDGMVVICDDSGVLALGGVIGGVSSAVDADTKNVYLECAYFSPASIARTGQKLQIDSDARYRFERGIDPGFTEDGAEIATEMILEQCGGEASELSGAGKTPDISRTIFYAPERLKLLGGSDLSEARQLEILNALGFTVATSGKAWAVKTPGWRHDVEGAADIVEEILRIDGYDNIPAVPVVREPGEKRAALSPLQKRVVAARHILAGRGLYETVTWSFMDDAKADLFGAQLHQNKKALTLVNPISADLAVMRPSILPNLIEAAGKNADRGIPDAALFEVGGVYKSPEYDGQLTVAGGVRSGNAEPRHWSRPARSADAMDAKADALAVLEACGVNTGSLQITADAPEWYHPGRSGVLRLGPAVLAYFGEFHPRVLPKSASAFSEDFSSAFGGKRDGAFVGFEVFLQNIPSPKRKGPRRELLKPSPFQPVLRDFAFIVDQTVEAGKLVRVLRDTDKSLISGVEIFDVYTGKGVEPGKKSVALAVTLQPVEKTLTDEDIAALSAKIIGSVQKQTGGALRG